MYHQVPAECHLIQMSRSTLESIDSAQRLIKRPASVHVDGTVPHVNFAQHTAKEGFPMDEDFCTVNVDEEGFINKIAVHRYNASTVLKHMLEDSELGLANFTKGLDFLKLHNHVYLHQVLTYPVMVASPNLVFDLKAAQCAKTFNSNMEVCEIEHWSHQSHASYCDISMG